MNKNKHSFREFNGETPLNGQHTHNGSPRQRREKIKKRTGRIFKETMNKYFSKIVTHPQTQIFPSKINTQKKPCLSQTLKDQEKNLERRKR